MKTRAETLALIEQEVKNLKPELDHLKETVDLTAELGLDSVQVLEMCMQLEDQLDISIPINRLGDVRTAGELADALIKIQQDEPA